jgi:hypothetical protein
MNDAEQLLEYLDTALPEKVQRSVTVVTAETLGQDYMIHISTDTNIRNFVPLIGRRQGRMEDRTVPRVTVAPTLLGAFIGYAESEMCFMEACSNSDPHDDSVWKGGWKIYGLPFQACLKPNAKMVNDTRMSDEHWLVRYSQETSVYKPVTLGRCFYRELRLSARTGKNPTYDCSLYIEVVCPEGIRFSKNIFLKQGCHLIEGTAPSNLYSWASDEALKHREVSAGEYRAQKNACAALLGLSDPVPSYLSW